MTADVVTELDRFRGRMLYAERQMWTAGRFEPVVAALLRRSRWRVILSVALAAYVLFYFVVLVTREGSVWDVPSGSVWNALLGVGLPVTLATEQVRDHLQLRRILEALRSSPSAGVPDGGGPTSA